MIQRVTIILKKLEIPLFKGFDKLLKKTREFAKKSKLTKKDIDELDRMIKKDIAKAHNL